LKAKQNECNGGVQKHGFAKMRKPQRVRGTLGNRGYRRALGQEEMKPGIESDYGGFRTDLKHSFAELRDEN
jgi:hypothetical protein